MSKLSYGVGFNSGGKYKTKEDRRKTSAYQAWYNMLMRCYSTKTQSKQKTYIGCSVTKEWYDFQVFAEWFYKQPYSDLGYQLDKDILVLENKIYSPETCCFLPSELNKLLLDRGSDRGILPQGVNFEEHNSKYRSRVNINGCSQHIGYFDCPHKAHQAYKSAKEAYVKEKALEWKDRIADNVFQALANWKLEARG